LRLLILVALEGFLKDECGPRAKTFEHHCSTSRRDQARSELQLFHLRLGRPLGRFPVGLPSRTCLTSVSCGIL